MTSSEFVLLSALRDRKFGEVVDTLVIELHQSKGLDPSALVEILQAMCSDGLVRRSVGTFRLSRVEITGKGILALDAAKVEAEKDTEDKRERAANDKHNCKSNRIAAWSLFATVATFIVGALLEHWGLISSFISLFQN